ncbi:hypothetical protein JOF57_000397 [Mycolicibacterium lutetiense]|uniref:Uncharacterized protein n=1 Tax=Mycolicibacterium lutetiense TaxID=1641992 RepID=A0ABS4ZM02_9MYCO|nr:hypothetical protein [Mycolicibacterium lutetiense]
MRSLPQEDHADLGLIEGDHTPDMRPSKSAPEFPVLAHRAGTDPNNPTPTKEKF